MRKAIKTAIFLINCREPEPVEIDYIAQKFIPKYHKGLKPEEFIEAFERYANGEFGDFRHYGNFTCELVGYVLKSYKEALRLERISRKPIPEMKRLPEAEGSLDELMEYAKKKFEQTGELNIAGINPLYDWLKEDINLSPEEYSEIYNKAKREIRREKINELQKYRKYSISNKSRTVIKAREIALKRYFKKQKNERIH